MPRLAAVLTVMLLLSGVVWAQSCASPLHWGKCYDDVNSPQKPLAIQIVRTSADEKDAREKAENEHELVYETWKLALFTGLLVLATSGLMIYTGRLFYITEETCH